MSNAEQQPSAGEKDSRIEHAFWQVNGLKLHLAQAGPESGPLVILLHGFPEFWYGWRSQIGALAEAGYLVLAPDQRGYNLSDKPAGLAAYRLDALVEDVLGLIDAAGREKALLVGHDWGAAVAWQVAVEHPERLEKLAILNVPHPAVMLLTLRSSLAQILKSWYIYFFQLPGLAEWSLRRRNFAAMHGMMLRNSKPGSFSPQDFERYIEAWGQPGALTAMLGWYRAAFRLGLRSLGRNSENHLGGRVQVPTLMLWGVRDIALSHRMASASIDQCDQGRLVFFEDATHWVQHDEPERVNALLLDFLKKGL